MAEKKKKLGTRGYTLVELMVVVTIIAILAAAATGVYRGYVNRAKEAALYDTARQIREALLVCEVEYMAENRMDSSVFWDEAFLNAPNHPDSILYPYVGEITKDCVGYTLKLGKGSNGEYQIGGFTYETESHTVKWERSGEITVTEK